MKFAHFFALMSLASTTIFFCTSAFANFNPANLESTVCVTYDGIDENTNGLQIGVSTYEGALENIYVRRMVNGEYETMEYFNILEVEIFDSNRMELSVTVSEPNKKKPISLTWSLTSKPRSGFRYRPSPAFGVPPTGGLEPYTQFSIDGHMSVQGDGYDFDGNVTCL